MTDEQKEKLLRTVIEDKQQKIEDIATPRLEKLDARQEAYQRIVDMMKLKIGAYLLKHPERASDQRSRDAEAESLEGLQEIFNILDGYLISFRPASPVEENHAT